MRRRFTLKFSVVNVLGVCVRMRLYIYFLFVSLIFCTHACRATQLFIVFVLNTRR